MRHSLLAMKTLLGGKSGLECGLCEILTPTNYEFHRLSVLFCASHSERVLEQSRARAINFFIMETLNYP